MDPTRIKKNSKKETRSDVLASSAWLDSERKFSW